MVGHKTMVQLFSPATYQGTRLGDGGTDFKEAKLSSLTPGDAPVLQRLQLDLQNEGMNVTLSLWKLVRPCKREWSHLRWHFECRQKPPLSWILVVKLKQLTRLMGWELNRRMNSQGNTSDGPSSGRSWC